jgi:bifunctional UDP-N-acetylglucosamine pyrophosphorylase / glucosamine-1-phosphate N-acetyltransferase
MKNEILNTKLRFKKKGPAGALILAAGKGKRMRSAIPKVLTPISGVPLIQHILDRLFEVEPTCDVGIVVGHQKEEVISAISAIFPNRKIEFIHQEHPQGTGHAVQVAMKSAWGSRQVIERRDVLVLPGDLPLISHELIEEMISPLDKSVSFRMLTAILPNPAGYGRVVRRGKNGSVLRIVEEKDATEREKLIEEVVLSIYTFQSAFLDLHLKHLKNNNAQSEYYLPDLVKIAAERKKKIVTLPWSCVEDVRGVNDPWELALAQKILNNRIVEGWAHRGVRFMDPCTAYIGPEVTFGDQVQVYPGVVIEGATVIGSNVTVGPHVHLKNVVIEDGAEIRTGTVAESSVIRARAKVGPYAHLRPESDVGADSKIGNYVELKKAKIGSSTSIAHLSYVGDADIGSHVNIGCGFVTCNFDGRVIDGSRKHKTTIEDGVFIGSDCQAVAPITIRKGAFVASGSTITDDVEGDALAIARARQVTKPGYAKKLRGE